MGVFRVGFSAIEAEQDLLLQAEVFGPYRILEHVLLILALSHRLLDSFLDHASGSFHKQ